MVLTNIAAKIHCQIRSKTEVSIETQPLYLRFKLIFHDLHTLIYLGDSMVKEFLPPMRTLFIVYLPIYSNTNRHLRKMSDQEWSDFW